MLYFSRVGLVLAGLFALFTWCVLFVAFTCQALLCKLAILLPVFPWFLMWRALVEGPVPAALSYFVMGCSIILNILLFYCFGQLIEWGLEPLYRRR